MNTPVETFVNVGTLDQSKCAANAMESWPINTCSDWYSQEVVDEREHKVDPDPLDRLLR